MSFYKDNEKIQYYLRLCLRNFKAHDFDHAMKVASNAIEIAANFESINLGIVEIAALFHDVLDTKNPNKIRQCDVEQFLGEWFSKKDISRILEITDNISTRKEIRGERREIHAPYLWIVSDADKLEAIGEAGIHRCFEYQKDKIVDKQERHRYVYDLFSTQYSRSYFIKFIRTQYARDKAELLFDEQEQWLKINPIRYVFQ